MSKHVLVVDRIADFRWTDAGYTIVTSRDYVAGTAALPPGCDRVVNLARNYDYLSLGYYVSLMAEARGKKVLPAVETILELGRKRLYAMRLPELEDALKRSIKTMSPLPTTAFSVRVYFGRATDPRFAELASRAFGLFRAPLFCLEIAMVGETPRIARVDLLALGDVSKAEEEIFLEALAAYTKARWRTPRQRPQARYDLAILHDPKETLPPSNRRALAKFVEVGERMGIRVELIQRGDIDRLNEFDALFIRETTAIDNHTFRFARRAQAEGLPVIDDPLSIQRCTNKVYLAELLAGNNVPTPKSVILHRGALDGVEDRVGYPAVLKVPDGAFSRGVFKAASQEEFRALADKLFQDSSVILAQAFTPTAFDWRVGILNRRPLFVCQYYMSRDHWQVVKHGADGSTVAGEHKSLAVEDAPKEVVDLALRAAGLIGDGLYGVDLKQNDQGVFVIEINDNPNIDVGVEDRVLKDELYRIVLAELIRRVEARRNGNGKGAIQTEAPTTAVRAVGQR